MDLLNSDSYSHRPANILLSEKNVPVLVDFGFAEQYRLESRKAFLSNISYGTPEVSHLPFLLPSSPLSFQSFSPNPCHSYLPTLLTF